MLVAELATNASLMIVQRERVDEIIREQAFQLSGRVTDESAVKVGRLIGANVLMTGRMTVVDGRLRLDAQFVGVEQGAILGAVAAEGGADDVASVARLLVAKVRALFPTTAHDAVESPLSGSEMLQAAKAAYDAEQLSREGKLFEALKEYERARALNPANTVVQRRIAHTLERLPPVSWMDPAGIQSDQYGVSRILERLAMGLEAEIGEPSADTPGSGGSGVRIPLQIRLSPTVLGQALEALSRVKGVMLQSSTPNGTTVVRWAEHSESLDAVVRNRSLAQRLFVRLMSGDGRTIAVYSDFRKWSLSNWIAIEGNTVRIRHAHVLASEAKFGDLSPDKVAAIAFVKVTIDHVMQERAIVRLDVQAVSEPQDGKDAAMPPTEKSLERHRRVTEQEKAMVDRVSPLRVAIEAAWYPPVVVRLWNRGYMPGNQRTAVVTMTLDSAQRRIGVEPRFVRVSGETEFDQAALMAARIGMEQWLSDGGLESLSQDPALRQAGSSGTRESVLIKIRAQFQLRQDVPAVNLIGAHALDRPFMPESLRSPVD